MVEILKWTDTRCACKKMKLDFKKIDFKRFSLFVTSKNVILFTLYQIQNNRDKYKTSTRFLYVKN